MAQINLVEKDNGTTVSAVKQDRVIISLLWNPSSGYFWQEADTTAGALESLRHEGSDEKPGVPALVHFTFRVEKSGMIHLQCARPWGELTPAKLFQVEVKT